MTDAVQEVEIGIGMRGLEKGLKKLGDLNLFIGFEGAEAEAIHTAGKAATVAQVAFWMEFGAKEFEETGTIPPRPFMELSLAESQDKLAEWYGEAIEKVLEGKSPEGELAKMGEKVTKLIRNKIDNADRWADPLAESTREKKKGPGVLRESEKMKRTLAWFVKKGDDTIKTGK